MPITGEFPERAIQKDHLNARWPLQSIARGEMLPDAFEMNIDSGFEMAFILPENLDPAAPRQKVRILRHIVYQIEHLLGGMRTRAVLYTSAIVPYKQKQR